jgi:hypothetical protein
MLTATLTVPDALQIIIYIDTMKESDRDPLHSLGLSIEQALRRTGLDDSAIFDVEHDEALEEKALERLFHRLRLRRGRSLPRDLSPSPSRTEKKRLS